MIKISEIQTGDVMFLRVRWNPMDIKTYLSRLINFGVNFWAGISKFLFNTDYTYCPANHVGIFLRDHQGKLYLHEADDLGFTAKIALVRLVDIKENDIWVKRFHGLTNVEENIGSLVGVEYDYFYLVKQFGNLLTGEQFESKKKKAFNKAVCSNSIAEILNKCNPNLCKLPYNYDPKDLWFEPGGEFVKEIYN